MFNIKIKSVPNKAKTGSQLDYSLVDRNTLFLKPNTPVDSNVKNTMGAVPRDEANIEAEGGETVVGDINNDGYLEHQTIVGKRHSQGGTPLNVPPGSFIFSDTDKLRIKDEEVLAIFGMRPNKKGYTPAEIAKKYQINDYIAILKDPKKDNYSKETAQIMLDSNMKKLGMLALVQESMKGFPDGLPAIAESVVAGMQGGEEMMQPSQEQGEGVQQEMMEGQEEPQEQEMRYGGGYYQRAGTTKEKQNKKQKVLPKKKQEEGFWDNREMPSFGQAVSNIFEAGPSAETYLATGINSLVHTGSWTGDGEKDAEGFAYGAKYMLPSELPQNAKLSKAQKILLDAAADPLNQFFIGKGLATIASKAIAEAAAKEVAKLSARHAARNTVKNEVSEELAKEVLKNAGKKITTRNLQTAKGAIAGAAKKAAAADFAGGARVGARNAMVVHDVTAPIRVAKAPIGYAYDKAGKLIKIIKDTPIKQIPGQIKNAIVSGAGATGDFIMNSSKADFLYPTISTLGRAYSTPSNEPVLEQVVKPANPNQSIPTLLTTTTAVSDSLQQQEPVVVAQPAEEPAAQPRQRIVYYDARTQAKPEDTPDVKYLPAQNSVQLKNPNLHNEEQYMINGEPVEYDPNFAYGGYYAGGGSSVDGDPPQKFVVGKDGKIGVRGADGKVTQTEFTKYLKYDKSVHGGKGGFRLELPSNLSFKERQNIANLASQNGFGNIVQSSNQRIDKNNPYQGFYAGLRPEDFEDKIVRENFGDEAADKMSDVDKRKQAFKILNIKVDDSKLADSKTLYNKDFIKNTFYPAFTKLLPEGKYRPEMGNDTMFGLEHLDAYKLPKKKETPVDTYNFSTPQRPIVGKRRYDPGWWAQDRINFAASLGDRVRKYNPAMANYNFRTPDYALENPARMIAAMQEKSGRYSDMLSNSTAGNVAGASMLNNFGEDLGAIANGIAGIENRNVNTYNNASAQGVQIMNQAEQMDQAAKQNYIAQQATANQQYDNALQERKYRQIGALNNGLTNWMAKKQMEQVLFPQYNINPMSGDVNFTGARQMFNNNMTGFALDTYQNPMYAGSNAGNIDVDSIYNNYINKGYSEERAKNLLDLQIKAMNSRSMGRGANSGGYGALFNSGRTLPQQGYGQQQQSYGAYAASPYSMYGDV
jgi:hypothetical protein